LLGVIKVLTPDDCDLIIWVPPAWPTATPRLEAIWSKSRGWEGVRRRPWGCAEVDKARRNEASEVIRYYPTVVAGRFRGKPYWSFPNYCASAPDPWTTSPKDSRPYAQPRASPRLCSVSEYRRSTPL